MKTLLRRRRDQASSPQPRLGLGGDLAGSPSPSRDHNDGELSPADKAALGARSTTISSGVHSMTTRALTLALAAAIACGPAAIIWRALTPPPQPVTAAATPGFDQRMTSRRAVASETAAAWVHAWLTTPAANADRLTAFYAGKVELPTVAAAAADVRVVDAVAAAPGVWSVVVTATVTADQNTATRRFYQVPVAVSGDPGRVQSAVMAIPAIVPEPTKLGAVNTGTYPVTVLPDSALGASVSAFLTALLTGAGEVSRYVSPGSELATATLEGPKYGAVNVRSIAATDPVAGITDTHAPADGTSVHVLAMAVVADSGATDQQGLSVSYPLFLTARGGRWEVTAIDTTLAASEATASRTTPGLSPSPTP